MSADLAADVIRTCQQTDINCASILLMFGYDRTCSHKSDGRLAAETEQDLRARAGNLTADWSCKSCSVSAGIACQQALSYFWRQFADIVYRVSSRVER